MRQYHRPLGIIMSQMFSEEHGIGDEEKGPTIRKKGGGWAQGWVTCQGVTLSQDDATRKVLRARNQICFEEDC